MRKAKISALLLTFCLCCSLVLTGCSGNDYKKATDLLNEKNYSEAVEIFQKLGDYKDSADKAKECFYEMAKTEYDSENYQGAYELFLEADDYNDADSLANESMHQYAVIEFDGAEYETALQSFTAIKGYKDADDKAALCEREIGMHEKADYEFLSTLEESVTKRMNSPDNISYSEVVNVELAYLSGFEEKDYYDSEIQRCAKLYIDGVNYQKDALNLEGQSYIDIEWLRGKVMRLEALNYLYENYGFLKDDKKFIADYITMYETNSAELKAYDEIEKDIHSQTHDKNDEGKDIFEYNGYEIYTTIKNNTDYTYSTVWEITVKDSKGTVIETYQDYIENVKPHSSYKVTFYCSVSDFDTYDWQNYYTNVKVK